MKTRKPNWTLWLNDAHECKFWVDNYIRKGILRKSDDESRLHLRKADHNLNFAGWIFEMHKENIPDFFEKETFYDWVITCYYYAVYHAASALMSREGYKSKSHAATLCFLIYHHYHCRKAIGAEEIELVACSLAKEDIETIGVSKGLREKACYDVNEFFEENLAHHVRHDTIAFVNKIKLLLE